jgi:hypothetical protein
MTLSDIITSKNNNKPVTVKALVTGRADGSYTVPSQISLLCKFVTCKSQQGCSFRKPQNRTLELPASGLLQFVDVSNKSFKKIVLSFTDSSCTKQSFAISKFKSLLRIFIVDPVTKDGKTFTCYFIGNDIEVNQAYEFSGTVIADPKTQNATAIFTSAKKVPSRIESFSITKEGHNKLNEFCVPAGADADTILAHHLLKLYESYAANVTHIYDRWDLHLAIDLVFHSPLSFIFDGESFKKGWADVAVIGDTRVGKGFVAEGFQKYFGVGEVVSGDNATLTGLIGGLKSIEKNWTVKWGKFPQNDGGLLILDETSKLSRYTLSHLTRIRSEGIAEIHKIQSYTAPARVRTLFILNPGNGKNISQFPYGIQSILSVFKDPATVSRFDYVLVVSKDEADTDMVNKARVSVPERFSQELEQQLIYWTWSRKISEIGFSEKAVERVYMLALDLADKYSFDVPLIQGENIRYKLAKIAACFAARVYSSKYSGKHLFIDAVHVECAWVFLNMIYKKRASSYYALSMIKKSLHGDNEKNGIIAIQKYFASFYSKRIHLLQVLLSNQTITMTDIAEQTGLDKKTSLEIIGRLAKHRLIERSGFSYVKTDSFTEYLRTDIMDHIN